MYDSFTGFLTDLISNPISKKKHSIIAIHVRNIRKEIITEIFLKFDAEKLLRFSGVFKNNDNNYSIKVIGKSNIEIVYKLSVICTGDKKCRMSDAFINSMIDTSSIREKILFSPSEERIFAYLSYKRAWEQKLSVWQELFLKMYTKKIVGER